MKNQLPSRTSTPAVDRLPAADANVLERLWSSLDSHFRNQSPVPPRTARLTAAGRQKMAKKLVEEAGEAALAAAIGDREELIAESADLLYHLMVLMASLQVAPEEVWAEMRAREAAYGLAEKRAKHAD
jgi:phosphoribosyl-ATP pyrophosphohydrolase